jgi:hypothetical protein
MTEIVAYSFKTEMSLEQIFERLNAVGPWRWIVRDSEHWGDYLWARAAPYYASVKIYVEPELYVVQIKFESDAPEALMELEALREMVLERVLPVINASDLTPTDIYD